MILQVASTTCFRRSPVSLVLNARVIKMLLVLFVSFSYRKLQDTSSVNLYQSHQHHYSQYSMPSGMRHRPHSAGPVISAGDNSIINSSPGPATLVPVIPKPTNPAQPVACANNHPKSLYDSLNRSFYITSYQKQISQPAASLNKGQHYN